QHRAIARGNFAAAREIRVDHFGQVTRCGGRDGHRRQGQQGQPREHPRDPPDAHAPILTGMEDQETGAGVCSTLSGSGMLNVVPTPGDDVLRIVPPCASTMPLAMYRTRPVPVFWCFLLAE